MIRASTIYLWRETALILLWAFSILFAGTLTGMLSFQQRTASAILGTALFGGWLLWRLLKREHLPRSGIEIALLVFLATQIVALVFSEDVRRSLPHAILWLTYMLIFFFALDLLRRGWPTELVEKTLLIVGAIVLALAGYELLRSFLTWQELTTGLELAPSFKLRLYTVFGDANLLAAFINLLIPLALARAFFTSSKGSKVLVGFYLAASLLILSFTGSRGGLLGFAASSTALVLGWIFVVMNRGREQVREALTSFMRHRAMFFAAMVVLIAISSLAIWRYLSFEGDATHAPVLDARDIYWHAALNAFMSDPLTGVGQGMYPSSLMKIWSTPPARPFLHAHNTLFQFAAESGLLGLAGVGLLVFAIIRAGRTKWQQLKAPGRTRWVAVTAALAGFAAHSMVDDFLPFLSAGAIVAVYLAILMAPSPMAKTKGGFSPLWLLLPAALAAVVGINPMRAYAQANAAVDSAAEGDWLAASEGMQAATVVDPDLAFYWLQAGYANGRVAEQDASYLDESITAYQIGIELEPGYALNHANLATLYFQAGDVERALQQILVATDLAPNSWLIWFNRGIYEEELGRFDDAQVSYYKVFALNPVVLNSTFWSMNDFRVQAANAFDLPVALTQNDRELAIAMVATARDLIAHDDLIQARDFLHQAWDLNDQEVELYIALAELSIAEGSLTDAEQYLQLAIWVQSPTNQKKVEAILHRAELALMWDDKEAALAYYRQAFDAIFASTSYGWGSYGWTPYGWFVFQRRAFPEDVLPQLERTDIPWDVAQRLLTLVTLYDERGETDEAEKVREALHPYLP